MRHEIQRLKMQKPVLFLLILFLTWIIETSEAVCGYESCPKVSRDKINVHLVPHSHDDIGWLKTVDQYYYGDKNSIQLAGVQYTLDSVLEQLKESPDRKFIYVETGFFWRWWKNRSLKVQAEVRTLVANGQLEFINGGWVMNDEATTHYSSIIDQMTLGLRFLNNTFGECGIPKVAWQIDPFGHSREQASLFAQMGFDGLFFGRLDYQDKDFRRETKNMEMIWRGSPDNLGSSSDLFTGVLFNGYGPPTGFCFDIFCDDDPINDDPDLMDYNVDKKVQQFTKEALEWAAPYKTNNILMTMGSDFQYMAANTWYTNLDKLIKYVNSSPNSTLNLFYSTPSCYLKAVHDASPTLQIKSDDFFPYASDPHAFWTGYFTSRPTLKYYTYNTNNILQATKQIATHLKPKPMKDLFFLSESLAVLQHHDAVSGTAKQHVTNDYAKRLSIGVKHAYTILNKGLSNLHSLSKAFEFCPELNVSSCAASEFMTDFVVSVYNPLAREVTKVPIRLPVLVDEAYSILGPNGPVPQQIVPIPESVLKMPGRRGQAKFELVFDAGTLAPLTSTSFQITRTNEAAKTFQKNPMQDHFWVQNSVGLRALFHGVTGELLMLERSGTRIQMAQNFYYYEGHAGNNTKFEFRASGAYIFRPSGSVPTLIQKTNFTVFKGPLVTEVHQYYNEWLSQVIRLYDRSDALEFEWLVGPIPIDNKVGKEIITRYSTNLETNGVFYTDSNGRELLKRKRDFRPTWDYKVNEPVAGNYYPVNSRMIISEGDLTKSEKTIILLNDRSQGGTSINDGEIEMMIHRRLLQDDGFGVGEPLNEEAYGTGLVARGKHWIILAGDQTGLPISVHRSKAQEIYMDKILSFADVSAESSLDLEPKPISFANLAKIFPPNVHLLTLEPTSDNEILLRLEHFYERFETPYNYNVSIPIQKLYDAFPFISSIRESTLGANQWKSSRGAEKLQFTESFEDEETTDEITLTPMQIKTFIVSLKQ